MTSQDDRPIDLSKSARSRRTRMRDELLGEVRRIRRARRQRRHAVMLTAIGALFVGGLFLLRPAPPGSSPSPPKSMRAEESSGPVEPHQPQRVSAPDRGERPEIHIERIDDASPRLTRRIETDEAILDRYRFNPSLTRVTYLSDAELVRELAAIGEPASVVRLPDRVLLVRADPRDRKAR